MCRLLRAGGDGRKRRVNDVALLSTGASAIRLHRRTDFCSRLYEEIIAGLSLAFQFHLCGARGSKSHQISASTPYP